MGQRVTRAISRMISWTRPLWMAALVVIIVGTLLPSTDGPPAIDYNDKLLHFGGYFALGCLGGIGWPHQRLSFLISMPVLGFLLEVIQGTMVPGRHFEMGDALANAVGTAVGVAVSIAIVRAASPHEHLGVPTR